MSNIIKIKRGSSVPSSSDLEHYELGYRTGTTELYINDGGTYRQLGGGATTSGSNNQLLTDDGSGGITSEGSLLFSGSTLEINNSGDWSYIKNNTNSGGLRLGTKDSGGTFASQIEISNTGNYVKLNENTTITGSLTTSSTLNANGNIYLGDDQTLYVGTDTTNGLRIFHLSSNNNNYIRSNGGALSIYTQTAQPLYFNTNNTNRLTISSGGDATFTGVVKLQSELDFTGNGNKVIDVETLENSNSFRIRNHNPVGNVFHDALKLEGNGGASLYYNNGLRFKTTSGGGTLYNDWNVTGALSFGSISGAISTSGNINTNGVYQMDGTTIIDSSKIPINIANGSGTDRPGSVLVTDFAGVTSPTASGWYTIASGAHTTARGGGIIRIGFTGGNATPATFTCDFQVDWSGNLLRCNVSNQTNNITKVRLIRTSSTTELQAYFSISSGLSENPQTMHVTFTRDKYNPYWGIEDPLTQESSPSVTGEEINGTSPTGRGMKFYSAATDAFEINNSYVTINELGKNIDFRVESSSDSNLLFTDGGNDTVGIGTNSPAHKLEVNGNIKGSRLFANDGSLGYASIAFADDQDTGLYSPGQGQTAFQQNGSESLRINSSGNVGIGENSPDTKLHIKQSGSASYTTLKLEDSARLMYLGRDAITVRDLSDNAAQLYINSNTTFSGSIVTGANITVGGLLSVTSSISTGYGVNLTNGNTNFLLYNNSGEDVLYMRDTTNGQMLQTWGTTLTTIHKPLSVTGDIKAADGSVGAPAFRFTSDTNTGIYRKSSDYMAFVAGGGERFAANGNGLDLSGANPNKIVMPAYGSRDKYRVWNSSYYTIGMDATFTYGPLSGYAMTFQMNDEDGRGWWWGHHNHGNGSGAMSLDTDGKLTLAHSMRLGYGESDTTEPGASYALDVNGNSLLDGNIWIEKKIHTFTNGTGHVASFENNNTYLMLRNPQGNTCIFMGGTGDSNNYYDNGSHRFRSLGGSTYFAQLNSTGLAIGTGSTYASAKLHVKESGTGAGTGGIITETATHNGNAGIRFRTNGTDRWAITTIGTNGADLRIRDVDGSADRVTIDSNGRVGIGVSSSIQEELDVAGVGKFRGNSQGSDVLELGQLNDGATTQQYLISTYDTAGGIRNVGDHLQIKSQRWGQDITFARNGQGGAVPTARFYSNGSNGYMELYKASNPSSDATYTNPIQLNVNGNSWLNGGNVGIGTSSPGSLLTVRKDGTQISNPSTSYQIMTVSNSNGGIAIQAGASSDAFLVFGDQGQYDAGRIRYHNDTHHMDFCTSGNNPRMIIDDVGVVAIGHSSPWSTVKLDLGATSNHMRVGGRIYLYDSNRYIGRNGNNIDYYTSSGIHNFTGNIQSSADVIAYASSDKRLKDNIKNIKNPLEKLEKINGVEFDWNDKQDSYKGHDIGVIAQEVEEVLPEIVDTREDGYKAVKYDKMVALLIEVAKEQQQQINELKEKLNG